MGVHCKNGSPENWGGHEQYGLWFRTLHNAYSPHVFGQGSAHFWLIQALSNGHSELTIHSGRQFGGFPT